MAKTPEEKFWSAAIPALEKNLRFQSERKMEENLEHACGDDVCEAFRMGAWEAQREMIARLRELQVKVAEPPKPIAFHRVTDPTPAEPK
jgi:hypothetical protein